MGRVRRNVIQSNMQGGQHAFDDAAGSKSECEGVFAVAAAVERGSVKKGANVMDNDLCEMNGAKHARTMLQMR